MRSTVLAPEDAGKGQCSRPASSSGSISPSYRPSPLVCLPPPLPSAHDAWTDQAASKTTDCWGVAIVGDDGVVASSHEDDAESSIWELAGDHESLSTATMLQQYIRHVNTEIYMFGSASSSSEELIEDKPRVLDLPESVILIASDTSSTSLGSSVIILASTTAVRVRGWACSEIRRREVRKAP